MKQLLALATLIALVACNSSSGSGGSGGAEECNATDATTISSNASTTTLTSVNGNYVISGDANSVDFVASSIVALVVTGNANKVNADDETTFDRIVLCGDSNALNVKQTNATITDSGNANTITQRPTSDGDDLGDDSDSDGDDLGDDSDSDCDTTNATEISANISDTDVSSASGAYHISGWGNNIAITDSTLTALVISGASNEITADNNSTFGCLIVSGSSNTISIKQGSASKVEDSGSFNTITQR